MNKLRFFAASAGVFFILSQALLAKATSPPVERPCFAPDALAKLEGAPAELRPKWMREVLQSPATAKCVSNWLFPAGRQSRDLSVLIKLMQTDDEISVRLQAASTLGWVEVERKVVMDALKDNLNAEAAAPVVLARIDSINMQLNDNWYGKWDESIRLDSLLNSLGMANYNGARTADEEEAILAAIGSVTTKLIAAPYALPGKLEKYHASELSERIANKFLGLMAVLPKQAAPTSPWRASVLNAMERALQEGSTPFQPEVHAPLMLSAGRRIDDPFPQVRSASLRFIACVADLLDRQADKAWQDFDPYLSASQVEQLVQSAARAMSDQDAHVRESAINLVGHLAQHSAGQGAALTAALSDPSIGVRKAAALALARKSSMPPEAIPRLVEMARQVDEDSPHAITALSKVGNQAVMDVLIDILLAAADAEVRAKEVPPPQPVPSWEWTPPERWLSPRELAKARAEAAARALDKFGAKVLQPLLARASQASTPNARARVYSVMVDAGWPSAAPGMQAAEAALTPAILGDDESISVFALSLLAAQPITGNHRYSTSLVDATFKRYLQDKPRTMSREEANPSNVMWVGGGKRPPHWNSGWRITPQRAASIIAGGSNSAFAAERMVAFVCARHRLLLGEPDGLIATWGGSPLSDEMDATGAMLSSLERMGEIATPHVQRALAEESPTLLCRRELDKNFESTEHAEPDT